MVLIHSSGSKNLITTPAVLQGNFRCTGRGKYKANGGCKEKMASSRDGEPEEAEMEWNPLRRRPSGGSHSLAGQPSRTPFPDGFMLPF